MMLKIVLVAVLSSLVRVQEPAPTPAPTPTVGQVPALVPGELPAAASEDAKALWREVVRATSGAAAQAKVTAFDLRFEGRGWAMDNKSEMDFDDGRVRFLAPGFVDSSLGDSGRRRLRGPKGDWIVDGKGNAVRLQGVDLEQDRRELDQIVHVSKTFVNLIDSKSLRLRALALLPTPPLPLPASLAARAKTLKWLDVSSPDFALVFSDGKASTREVRAWIGVDAASKLPQLACVAEEDAGKVVAASSLLIAFDKYRPLDGFQVPFEIKTFPPITSDDARAPWAFTESSKLSLWLLEGSLRPTLAPAQFEPPKK